MPSTRTARGLTVPSACLFALLVACSGGGSDTVGPLTPGSMEAANAGSPQTGTAGMPVAAVPSVKVTSTTGEAISGVSVSFAVTAGGGSVGNATAQTNSQGIASAGSWTLGPNMGSNQLTATTAGLSPVQFAATATAGAPASIQLVGGGDQTASVLATLDAPVVLRVADAGGNPVAGIEVKFGTSIGLGWAEPWSATSGSDGTVEVLWTLGRSEGAQELTASIDGTSISRTVGGTGTFTPLLASSIDVSLAGLGMFKCAVRLNGEVTCWGRNMTGQLGDGSSNPSMLPVQLAGGPHSFTTVALGEMHACALTDDGAPYCWGQNMSGAVGVGEPSSIHPTPVPVGEDLSFTRLDAGRWSTCGLTSGGSIWCWGATGRSSPSSYPEPTQVVGSVPPVSDYAIGRNWSCATPSGGFTQCWGGIFFGAPSSVLSPTPFIALSSGENYVCGLITDGTAYCWGSNSQGQLGDGSPLHSSRSEPAPISSALKFTAISAGDEHACAIATDGDAYCWGTNQASQLGNGHSFATMDHVTTPERVDAPDGVTFRSIAAGGLGTCAIAPDDKVYCWGVEFGSDATGSRMILRPELVPDR